MKLRIVSDLHSEFFSYNKIDKFLEGIVPPLADDADTTLILAGDTGTYQKYASTLKPVFAHFSKRFKHVIAIPGNHEYYGSVGIWGHEKEYWNDKKLPTNLHYLDNDYKIIDDVMFIGSCLWTDFNKGDSVVTYIASKQMNDYIVINKQAEVYASLRLCPEDTMERHHKSVEFIEAAVRIALGMKLKPVVVSHTAPTEQSVHAQYRGDMLNHAFFTNLEWLMGLYKIPLWVHGHTHTSFDYSCYDTRVVCNPYGYKDHEVNVGFDGGYTLEV